MDKDFEDMKPFLKGRTTPQYLLSMTEEAQASLVEHWSPYVRSFEGFFPDPTAHTYLASLAVNLDCILRLYLDGKTRVQALKYWEMFSLDLESKFRHLTGGEEALTTLYALMETLIVTTRLVLSDMDRDIPRPSLAPDEVEDKMWGLIRMSWPRLNEETPLALKNSEEVDPAEDVFLPVVGPSPTVEVSCAPVEDAEYFKAKASAHPRCEQPASVDVLVAQIECASIDDVEYFKAKMSTALRLPKSFMFPDKFKN